MTSQDQARVDELKRKVYGRTAQKLLEKHKTPYLFLEKDIEGHKGRVTKALRLLEGAQVIVFDYLETEKFQKKANKNRTPYERDSKSSIYRVLTFDTDAEQYGTEPEFHLTWDELYPLVMKEYQHCRTTGDFGLIGDMSPHWTPAIYVWFNHDEFLFNGVSFGARDPNQDTIYPVRHHEARQKAILKAVVERHFQTDFTTKLETYMGFPEDSLKKTDEFDRNEEHIKFRYRNFTRHPASFDAEHFEGSGGFLEEYAHYAGYVTAMQRSLLGFVEMVKARGGYDAIVEEMRRDSITMILRDAPKHINNQDDDDAPYDPNKQPILDKWAALFILQNPNWFNYETLYGDDASMHHIEFHGVDRGDAFKPFEAPADELKVIQQHKGALCPTAKMESVKLEDSLKMISETFTDTSKKL